MIALTLFASTFLLVFALGFQSLNVNNGHYWAAAITSLVIGSMQLVMLKLGPDATPIEAVAFISGGPFGIVASMWAHQRTLGKRRLEAIEFVRANNTPGEIVMLEPHQKPHAANINCGDAQ
jgi:hypothetical protein